MEEYAVPINKSGKNCPLNGKPTCEVCHNCELWQVMPINVEGGTKMQFKCALLWQPIMTAMGVVRMDAVQKASEQTRNAMVKFKQDVGLLLASLASGHEPQKPIELVEDGTVNRSSAV